MRTLIVPKKFPVKAEDYKYPEPIIDPACKTPLYMTTNRTYGKMLPVPSDMPPKYFPGDNTFTQGFPCNYKFDGFNTSTKFSKVHKKLDEF